MAKKGKRGQFGLIEDEDSGNEWECASVLVVTKKKENY